ncbi:nucleotidyl transferase AbiEii/AbiGii toxin family protein [Pedobacter mucosus]|uniref:nucleotidyl transferase AbiEii/AbiGii toxin family protein n=1 Tax=Pedobacter mucosus TaxID=2895286 RepID=UPI001EE4DB9A|nr:nucleotidyl transferase AbiEii/AbiGii toxin family protein [Pedobacter mucosus]UKT63058.1 nucleotidyl transferase AbiEii/AbiGii toxin family protein [Pedobacter mucosus]
MLYKEAVTSGTLDLILELMKDQQLNSFYLVGGTALSLRIGHRKSIDIDLFSSSDFDGDGLAVYLRNNYGADVKRQKSNYVSGNIGEVDFDFISHKYPSIKPIEKIDGIRMMSNEDISAMKINAIVNSGQRIKDFIDVHYLLKEISLSEMLDYYIQKYPNVDSNTAKSSLLYHHDIDFTVPVILTDSNLKWLDVQGSISEAVMKHTSLQESKAFNKKIQEVKSQRKNDRSKGMGR